MKDFRELAVWTQGYDLALDVYRLTAGFPKEETYGLTAQIRRACVSIPANIAEGCGRSGDPELMRFLVIAMGSASELECLLMLARDLGYLRPADHASVSGSLISLRKMLNGFIQKMKADRSLDGDQPPVRHRIATANRQRQPLTANR